MADEEVQEYAGKYDDLVAVIANSCYVIASAMDMDVTLYDEAYDNRRSIIMHSLKVIKKCQEAILKDINSAPLSPPSP